MRPPHRAGLAAARRARPGHFFNVFKAFGLGARSLGGLALVAGCQAGLDPAAEEALAQRLADQVAEKVAEKVAASVAASLAPAAGAPRSPQVAASVSAAAPSAPAARLTPTTAPASAPAAAAPEAAWQPGAVGPWPASDRTFAVAPTPGAPDVVLGADGDALWLARATADGRAERGWRVTGSGVVQRAVAGDFGRGHRIYAARGVGRGHLQAPLVLEEIDPATGAATELWRHAGERNECAHLSVTDVDGDGKPELAFAYYSSKYMVRTRHLRGDGGLIEGPEVRMATGRVFADLDGDGKPDEAVARVYGEDRGLPGDLKVQLSGPGGAGGPITVPTDNGVRGLVAARLSGDPGVALYFADGWVADYGKQAKAQLQRARWQNGAFAVETVATRPDEFTFFELWAADVDGDGATELVAQGNLRVSLFEADGAGALQARELLRLEPILNVALARFAGGWAVVAPGRPSARVAPVASPAAPTP